MTSLAALALLIVPAPASPIRIQMSQLTIRRSVIVRVPAQALSTQPRIAWTEKKGPRCTTMDEVAGAVVAARDSVDLILRNGARLRAAFAASCPALSYYSGFYILPTADRRICADRDSIHDRSGGECAIERFRRLIPATTRPSTLERVKARLRRFP